MSYGKKFSSYFVVVQILLSMWIVSSCTVLPQLNKRFTLDALDKLGAVDQIKLYLNEEYPNQGSFIKTIDDPKEIDLIVNTFHNYSHNWKNYIPATPPAPISIHFYHKGEIQLVIAIGYTDQTTSKDPIYYLNRPIGSPGRPLTEQEFKELIEVLGIEGDLAYSN